MIQLFHINDYTVDTSSLGHHLHGPAVSRLEEEFSSYVGAKYSCGANSATSLIFLALKDKGATVSLPSMIPPVVCNAALTSGNRISFHDDTNWVGDSYILHDFKSYKIIDSAQKVERDQFKREANDGDLMIFSFYPTKPVGSLDGGIIVSNDYDKIKWFKEATFNGMSYAENNWDRGIAFPGWKMYLDSVRATIALNNLHKLENKKYKLKLLRDYYNQELGYSNTSEHLYRIEVNDNKDFIKRLKEKKIICGIHYRALSDHPIYCPLPDRVACIKSESLQNKTVSIPYHENITDEEAEYILNEIKQNI